MTDPESTQSPSQPEVGLRPLFFSGGTALNNIAAALKRYTHNSVHLITPFDSGGSSQVLRQAFNMPAVGDLRSRLIALADDSGQAQRAAKALLSHRLAKDASRGRLESEFHQLLDGSHGLMTNIETGVRDQILAMLAVFAENMPSDFNFRRASVGNLILAGGYFTHDKALEPVLDWMSKTVGVLGTVRAIADVNLQIGVELDDGSRVIGQANFTGKEAEPIRQPIRRLYMADETGEIPPEQVLLPARNAKLIETADLICFPPGSLFSSVIANLLPKGVGRAVAEREVPKIYVPSLGNDPECFGMTLSDQVAAVLAALRRDAGEDCPARDLISQVLANETVLTREAVERIGGDHGIPCTVLDTAANSYSDHYDPEQLSRALISLI